MRNKSVFSGWFSKKSTPKESGGEYYDDDTDDFYEEESTGGSESSEKSYYDREMEDDEEMLSDGEVQKETNKDLEINLIDKDNTLIAQAVVAGMDEGDIEIDLNREMLEIKTSSNTHCFEQSGKFLYEEFSSGSYARTILLPAEVDVEGSKAAIKNGILTITMPKIDKTIKKKVTVKKH